MSRRSWHEIFAAINDPGIPLLFLIGTTLFAIFGNALYDVLVALAEIALGEETAFLYVAIAIASLLLLLIVTLALWLWYNLRRSKRNRLPDTARIERPFAGLVIFVSANPRGSEQTAIRFHLDAGVLRRIWMIVTPEAEKKAQELIQSVKQRAEDQGYQVRIATLPIEQAFDIRSAYQAVLQAFEQAADQIDNVIVDITGGTKHMSAGAVLACREYGVPMQYVLGEIKDGKIDERGEGELMKVRL